MLKYNEFLNENKLYKYSELIEYTYLNPHATVDNIKDICETAEKYNFMAICVDSEFISEAYSFVEDLDIKVVSMVDFPKGDSKNNIRLSKVKESVINGADEINLVLDTKRLIKTDLKYHDPKLQENDEYVKMFTNLNEIANYIHSQGKVLKVCIESGELDYNMTNIACIMSEDAGADYIMTSTGTKKKGAEVDKIKYMKKILKEWTKILASGGVHSLDQVKDFIKAGAHRVATSKIPY